MTKSRPARFAVNLEMLTYSDVHKESNWEQAMVKHLNGVCTIETVLDLKHEGVQPGRPRRKCIEDFVKDGYLSADFCLQLGCSSIHCRELFGY